MGSRESFCKSGKRPRNIPAAPDKAYKDEGWQGIRHWLHDSATESESEDESEGESEGESEDDNGGVIFIFFWLIFINQNGLTWVMRPFVLHGVEHIGTVSPTPFHGSLAHSVHQNVPRANIWVRDVFCYPIRPRQDDNYLGHLGHLCITIIYNIAAL